MINYVCGFYFDHLLKQVVLIWKDKPEWQIGKLNGVGGKIEKGEAAAHAMRREFKEETGIDHAKWEHLINLSGAGWKVYFYCAIGKEKEFEYAETRETEEVVKIRWDELDRFDHIPNLQWLVPMAYHKLKFPHEEMSM